MKIGNKKRINVWVVFLIITLSVLLLGIVSYAAYTNLNSVKRVVSTKGMKGTPFSSNYLNLTAVDESSYSVKNITFPETSDTISFIINVCNYVHNTPSDFNENDIEYTFTLTLKNPDNVSTDGLKVTYGGSDYFFSGNTCVFTNTLRGRIKSVDTYEITLPKSFVDKVRIEAVALPVNPEYTGNSKLGRLFAFTGKTESATTWTGRFSESTTEGCDGFNYILSGQGKGTITLEWKGTELDISRICLDTLGAVPTENGDKKSVEIEVDSDVKNRIDIQFYKTDGGTYTDMNTVNGYVTMSFAATE